MATRPLLGHRDRSDQDRGWLSMSSHQGAFPSLLTYVPPTPPLSSLALVEKGSSHTATLAPYWDAKREARTPPLPAPIVNRS